MIKLRDPVSGLTHLAGVFLSVIGLVLLVQEALARGTVWHLVAFTIFGVSLILLYSASSLYHLLPLSERGTKVLRYLDHSMIYVLITGTYVPFCLISLRGPWGWGVLGGIVGIAILGIVAKILWLQAPRWLYTGAYLLMSWLVLIPIVPLVRSVPAGGLQWLFIGGFFYTVGAVFYATKWPPGRVFGFHEIWHLFVLAGSMSHFWAIYHYLI
ncbi:MAG: hemolysin III family protein [Limnochordaceae bacterium]|nr:hemolysin III family protein [Limnochordaceae bacterium]